VGREVLHARLALEAVLGAVAVMHVEIEDRHALQAVHVERLPGADGDAVKQTKTHGPLRLGVMAGRTQRTERVGSLAADHRIHGGDGRAGGAQRRLARTRRHHGVGIEAHVSRGRLGAQHGVDVARRVHALQLRAGRPRRLAPLDADERAFALLPFEGGHDRPYARDRFRVTGPGVVLERGWVHVQQRGHAARLRAGTGCVASARSPR
jgi:hypothetical protein